MAIVGFPWSRFGSVIDIDFVNNRSMQLNKFGKVHDIIAPAGNQPLVLSDNGLLLNGVEGGDIWTAKLISTNGLSNQIGTVMLEFSNFNVGVLGYLLSIIIDGVNLIRVRRVLSGNRMQVFVSTNSVTQANLSCSQDLVLDRVYRMAFSYATNNVRAQFSPSLGVASPDTSVDLAKGAFSVFFGARDGLNTIGCYHLRRAIFFSKIKSDASQKAWAGVT